jgi:hypothetical protein
MHTNVRTYASRHYNLSIHLQELFKPPKISIDSTILIDSPIDLFIYVAYRLKYVFGCVFIYINTKCWQQSIIGRYIAIITEYMTGHTI